MGLNGSFKKKSQPGKKGSSRDRDTSVHQLTPRRMWIPLPGRVINLFLPWVPLTLDLESRSIANSQKRSPYSTMLKNHFTSERHMDDLLVGVPQLRARNCKWTNAACDLSPGRPGTTSEADIKRLDGTGKNTVRELCCSLNALQDREDESGGTERKRDGINNETFIKRGGTWHILCCTCRLLMQPLLFVVPRVCTTLYGWKQPLPYWHFYMYAPYHSPGTKFALFGFSLCIYHHILFIYALNVFPIDSLAW